MRLALCEATGDVLLYAPVASRAEFINAIAYLVRRLDENTADENFLRYAPKLSTDSKAWAFLKNQFLDSSERIRTAATSPHRIQDRSREVFPEKMGTYYEGEFRNEPDTDWSLAANRKWAEDIRTAWKKGPRADPLEIPLVIEAREIFSDRLTRDCLDSSQYHDHVIVARFALADESDIEKAVAVAKADPDGWRQKSLTQRHAFLSRVAMELRRARGDLIGVSAANTGKVFTEADVEVSEAIDFAEYYPYSAKAFADPENISARGKGVGCVISPWNFPIAIPCGGIVASLAAGNTVIFKPSSDAVVAFLHSKEGLRLSGDTTIQTASDEQLVDMLTQVVRIRYAAPNRAPASLLKAAAQTGFYIARAPVLMEGRIELLHYLVNQSICDSYHRYGNLGERGLEN